MGLNVANEFPPAFCMLMRFVAMEEEAIFTLFCVEAALKPFIAEPAFGPQPINKPFEMVNSPAYLTTGFDVDKAPCNTVVPPLMLIFPSLENA